MTKIVAVRIRTMKMIRVYPFTKKAKSKSKRKSDRRPKWNNDDVDDRIDIVVNSDYYKRKLIFTNTKNQQNGEIYGQIRGIQNLCSALP